MGIESEFRTSSLKLLPASKTAPVVYERAKKRLGRAGRAPLVRFEAGPP